MSEYIIAPARYSKGNMCVSCPSPDGFKTRAARLIGDALKGRYSGREKGYIVPPSKAKKFERLHAEGWDASTVTGELIAPRVIAS